MDTHEAPPGHLAFYRTESVVDGIHACQENGGCAFADLCAPIGSGRGSNVPGFPGFSCRSGYRKDETRVLFKRALYGNEEDD